MTKPYLKPTAHDNPPKQKAFLKYSWTLPQGFLCSLHAARKPPLPSSAGTRTPHCSLGTTGGCHSLSQSSNSTKYTENTAAAPGSPSCFQKCSAMASETPAWCKAWSGRDDRLETASEVLQSQEPTAPRTIEGQNYFFFPFLPSSPKSPT